VEGGREGGREGVSAGHTREEIEQALKVIDEFVDLLRLRYAKSVMGGRREGGREGGATLEELKY